jgi:hypothetical protein
MSILRSKIVHLEDGDFYMIEIIKAASEQLSCKSLGAPRVFFLIYIVDALTIFYLGTCLDTPVEDRRVGE